jgi:hypothetical protein
MARDSPGAKAMHPWRRIPCSTRIMPRRTPPHPCTELYGSTEKQLAQTERRRYRETALGTPQGGFPLREKQSDRIAKVDVEGSSPFTRSQACNRGQRPRLLRFCGRFCQY